MYSYITLSIDSCSYCSLYSTSCSKRPLQHTKRLDSNLLVTSLISNVPCCADGPGFSVLGAASASAAVASSYCALCFQDYTPRIN